MEKLTCSIPEAAKLLGISKSAMYPLARSEGFPTIKVGKRLVISVKGLERWVEQHAGGNYYEN
jgi:excisionase family DNA binding protein